ncbi:helix-turn-helix domain-containing protein [Streptomyces sp. NBC_01408]|uniref:helix-turn-helix domain-containing protein n=1 Tax=Streptomyces sp. NBC_01408 TaxID=2903855 RepID=UPI00225C2511|nr:helix-turn-helix domain-containing protein [Streptomyces sp. NBC_01408]MCX4696216.1 helix-turn-helix domain-containing protein [Streptomyces sp. NBC_01408]
MNGHMTAHTNVQHLSTHSTDPAATAPLGSLIRAHRLRIGLTQRELADLSTISVRAIRDLEQGKARRPRPDTVRLMADALRLGPRARSVLEAAAQQGRATGHGPAELPAPPAALHPLVGRDPEAAVLAGELASATERLVNVVGLTGVGKTRLALEVAARLHATGLPVLWHAFPGATADHLGCAGGEPAARVAAAVAELCAVAAGRPGEVPGTAADRLAELLADQPALLVLDGAPAGPPRFDRLTGLLRACPGLRLLVTSDQPWEVPGERIFLLSPLEVPGEGAADPAAAAVRVFLGQVRRVRPEFVPGRADLERAAWICRRLDGHPGALAAAASWLVVCDLAALCQSLDADPVALLDHLGAGAGAEHFRAALRGRMERLPLGARELMASLCDRSGEEFSLADLTALTGLGLAECGRMLRELLISGAVRAAHEGGSSRFRVLGLVRAACGAGLAAAAGA